MIQCYTCEMNITGKACTTLECGHTFHPHCIHNFFSGTGACPICPVSSHTQLDFGDHPNIANVIRNSVYCVSPPSTTNRTTPTATTSQTYGGIVGWLHDKLRSSPNSILDTCSIEQLVQFRAPIEVFLQRKVSMRQIATAGVRIKQWFGSGYTLENCKILGVTWQDLIFMGANIENLCNLPVPFLVDVLRVDISHMLSAGATLKHLSRYSPSELLTLKCSSHVLINMGIKNSAYADSFNFSNDDWKKLAL